MNVNTPDDIKNKPDKVNLNNFDRWDAEMPALDMPEEDMPDMTAFQYNHSFGFQKPMKVKVVK